MVSTFCREAGQFLIASGSSYVASIGSAETSGSTLHKGTALRLVVQPTKVALASDQLFESVYSRSTLEGAKPLITASTLRRLGLDSFVGSPGNDALKS